MENYMGRAVQEKRIFLVDGDFESMYAAQSWLKHKGYSYGSTCAMYPTAVVFGDYNLPQKWKNFDIDDVRAVDGVMTGDMRNGTVIVYLFNTAVTPKP